MAGLMKKMIKGINVTGPDSPAEVAAEPKSDITVPAGTFKGAAAIKGRVSLGPVEKSYSGWYHPAVPLSGGVKSRSDDGQVEVELLDYGTR